MTTMTECTKAKRRKRSTLDKPPTHEDWPPCEDLRELPYVHHPSFSLPATAERLWGRDREEIPVAPYRLLPEVEEMPDGRKRTSRTTLTREQERTLFLRYNFAKYRVRQLARMRSTARQRAQIDLWRERARDVRERIIHANLPLVPAVAKRKHVRGVEFADKVSEGYMAILRSVEHFDVSRGFKFSTYACRAILAVLYRLGSKAETYRKHVPFQYEPSFEKDDYCERNNVTQRDNAIDSVRLVLHDNAAELTDIEAEVTRQRFPLGGEPARPLWKVGRDLGVSTERVRQIEKASLKKLGHALDEVLTA